MNNKGPMAITFNMCAMCKITTRHYTLQCDKMEGAVIINEIAGGV